MGKSKVDVKESVRQFYETKQTRDAVEKEFDKCKDDFYKLMDSVFDEYVNQNGKVVVGYSQAPDGTVDEVNENSLVVTKVAKREVVWDIAKMKETFSMSDVKKILTKQYQVIDWQGLFKFLKESGVNPKELMKYLSVTETVDEKKLDKLTELGEIDREKVKECSVVVQKSRYYKVAEK